MTARKTAVSLGLISGLLLAIVFLAGFGAGVLVHQSIAPASPAASDPQLKDFLAAYRLVTQQSYYRPFDRQHLIEAAIDGMLSATGDPHTLYLSPGENRVADTELNGTQFSGIGAIVVPDHGKLDVLAPLPKEPAALAGIQAGDVVIRINGKAVSRMAGNAAVARIHGRAGSLVRLTVVRNHGTPFTVSVRRAHIPPITAYGRLLGHHLASIQIMSFGATTSHEVADAISYVQSHGARAIILDLRGNPGGYVDAAQRVVSMFVARGVVAYERAPDGTLQPLPVLSGLRRTTDRVAVLVDGGTASAAEITAAALHDDDAAKIIGTRTYGKGSMQSVYALSDGGSIRITDRMWLTPRKRSIQKVGIHPDIVVPALGGAPGFKGPDPQLAVAERFLLQRLNR